MEFYSAILDKLCEQNPVLNQVFKGAHSSVILCGDCNAKSISSEPFTDICLDISKLKEKCHVEDGLKDFIQPEIIDEYRCEKCKSRNPSTKTMLIRNPPKVLTLRMNRFDPFKNDKKINKLVAYPEMLDISDYMETRPKMPKLYSLYGVLVHKGAFNFSGHYFSFVKVAGRWYRADDCRVREVDQSTVLKQSGAYVLCYREVDSEKGDMNTLSSKGSCDKVCKDNVTKTHVKFIGKNIISKADKPVRKSDKCSAVSKTVKANSDVNKYVIKVGKTVENPVQKSSISDKSVVSEPTSKANVPIDDLKERKKPVKPFQSTTIVQNNVKVDNTRTVTTPLGISGPDSVHVNYLPNKSLPQEATVSVQRDNPIKITNLKTVALNNSGTEVHAKLIDVVPSFGGITSTCSAPITSVPTCDPCLISVSMMPKPIALPQVNTMKRNLSSKPRVPIENSHIYTSVGRTYSSNSSSRHQNVIQNCQFQLQHSLLSHKTSQSLSATSHMSSTIRMRFAAQTPVMSYSTPVKKVAQKRRFIDINECRTGFGEKREKRQRINVIRIPEGTIVRRAIKRKPVYQCVNLPLMKVMRIDNSMCS